MLRVAEDVVLYLAGQFAGRRQNQSTDGPVLTRIPLEVKAVDHGQAEGRGLTGSCLRYAEHVMAGEHFGDGLGLDGGWGFVAQRLGGLQYFCAKA